jgi:hypothetical protein
MDFRIDDWESSEKAAPSRSHPSTVTVAGMYFRERTVSDHSLKFD